MVFLATISARLSSEKDHEGAEVNDDVHACLDARRYLSDERSLVFFEVTVKVFVRHRRIQIFSSEFIVATANSNETDMPEALSREVWMEANDRQ